VSAGAADAAAVAQIADKLVSAKHPVMVTSYAGRKHERRADRGDRRPRGIRVFEAGPLYLNISRASPCFAGMMPAIAEADVGLLVDVDVPWIPKHTKENPQTWWAHIDVDVVKECFPSGVRLERARAGRQRLILRQLLEALKAKATPVFRDAVAKRMEAIKRESASGARPREAGRGQREEGASTRTNLCAEISKAIGDDAIVVNEGIRNGPSSTTRSCAPGPAPRSFRGRRLGSSSGTALGIKSLARGDRAADGRRRRLLFRQPVLGVRRLQAIQAADPHRALRHSGWSAVKEATLRVYPEGDAKATNESTRSSRPTSSSPRSAKPAGGYGRAVDDPKRCPGDPARLKECARRRSALAHVRIPVL